MRAAVFATVLALSGMTAGHAADIGVVGLFPGKAVLVVNGGAPRTYAVGAAIADGAKLVGATQTSATVEVNGKRQTIALGEYVSRSVSAGPASVTLEADGQGHFVAQGQINGGAMRMLVDTGASNVALPASDAIRLGIDYKKGRMAFSNTANGVTPIYVVKLDRVRVGDIEISQVDASIHESGLQMGLLGMSFLNRMEMRREGQQMTLTKRY